MSKLEGTCLYLWNNISFKGEHYLRLVYNVLTESWRIDSVDNTTQDRISTIIVIMKWKLGRMKVWSFLS